MRFRESVRDSLFGVGPAFRTQRTLLITHAVLVLVQALLPAQILLAMRSTINLLPSGNALPWLALYLVFLLAQPLTTSVDYLVMGLLRDKVEATTAVFITDMLTDIHTAEIFDNPSITTVCLSCGFLALGCTRPLAACSMCSPALCARCR